MDSTPALCWTSQFVILGVSGLFVVFCSFFNLMGNPVNKQCRPDKAQHYAIFAQFIKIHAKLDISYIAVHIKSSNLFQFVKSALSRNMFKSPCIAWRFAYNFEESM